MSTPTGYYEPYTYKVSAPPWFDSIPYTISSSDVHPAGMSFTYYGTNLVLRSQNVLRLIDLCQTLCKPSAMDRLVDHVMEGFNYAFAVKTNVQHCIKNLAR